MFKFSGMEDDCKIYYTEDEKYSVIERPDGVFLTYKWDGKEQCYNWLEDKSDSLKECERFVVNKG